jgi:hypothetical protein
MLQLSDYVRKKEETKKQRNKSGVNCDKAELALWILPAGWVTILN